MSRNEILTEIFNDSLYKGYAASFYPHLADELVSEMINCIIEVDFEKLSELHKRKELKYYCMATLRNLATNKNLSFKKLFINNNSEITENLTAEISSQKNYLDVDFILDDIDSYLKKQSEINAGKWYDETLFCMYFKDGKTFRDISKFTNIPAASIFHSVKNTQKEIIGNFKKNYDSIRSE